MSVNTLGFILQSLWFKTAGFILTLFSPAQRVQSGSLWKHKAKKLLCYSSKTTAAFRAIPRGRRVPGAGWAQGSGQGMALEGGVSVLCPAATRRRGAKSSSSLWRHSGIYLQSPESGSCAGAQGERWERGLWAEPAGLQPAALSLGCSGGLCQLPWAEWGCWLSVPSTALLWIPFPVLGAEV